MSYRPTTAQHAANLRGRAASRLSGAAAAKGAPASAFSALAVIHDLASSPATADDALALLHELQVHQVEVDLQAEELRESRSELELALRRQLDLYDLLPVGCFTIDGGLVIHELNPAGASMLGIKRDEACGLLLDGFLSPESGHELRERVSSVAEGKAAGASTLCVLRKAEPDRTVRAHVCRDPDGLRFLLVLLDPENGQG